tara:strand:+ start:1796 stop:2884 length:1089 start_codon:yes stop_codon:yes gene_type:complete
LTRLTDLFQEEGQSPWLDNLKRSWLHSGELEDWVTKGVRGVTSNPSIFEKAMTDTDDYDQEFKELIADGKSVTECYWELVISDILGALNVLKPVFDSSKGSDGFVSVEVDPRLARETSDTLNAARSLHNRIDEPNVLIKIPATRESLPAVETMISEGRSVNVTLIFSLSRYIEVMEAYISGLENCSGDLSHISSVASFFISRTDTEVDKRLDSIGSQRSEELKGRAAVALGQVAYSLFKKTFSGPRWEALESRGARVQRPLWASTSTKNPDYLDTLYVDTLIGPDTVNTLPNNTIEAFEDHGSVARTVDLSCHKAEQILAEITSLGIDFEDVGDVLETEGIDSFISSFENLIQSLATKASSF